MVNFSKPLTYECLKTVLQHLKPNKRFQVAQKCPTIRTTEKLVPLKIDSLTLCKQEMIVNETNYRIGSFRKYPSGVEVPRPHQNENANGGTPKELDKFGAPEREKRFYPGDLCLSPPGERSTDEGIIEYFTARINELLADSSDKSRVSAFISDQVADIRTKKQALINRRDNIPAPFKTMTAFTVTPGCSKLRQRPFGFWLKPSGNSEITSERMEIFTKSMPNHKAMKHLLTFMFGGRREAVQVEKLAVPQYTDVLRLPLVLKFRVRELEVNGQDISVLATVIDEKSHPLARLSSYKLIETVEDISHPLESTARKLVLSFSTYNQLIARLPNHEIFLEYVDMEHLQLLFGEVLRHWTTNGREIGSSFTFDVDDIDSEELKNWIMGVAAEFNGRRIDETTIAVPLSNASEIRIIHRKFDEINVEDEDSECGLLRIEVVPIAMEH